MNLSQQIIDTIATLYAKFCDSKEEYLATMQTVLPNAEDITVEPFGVIYSAGGKHYHARVMEQMYTKKNSKVVIEIVEYVGEYDKRRLFE